MKNYIHIAVIGSDREVDPEVFGRKASNLDIAAKAGFSVPTAFCISAKLCERISKSSDHEAWINTLAKFVTELFSQESGTKLIVRSSSRFEDKASGQFAGLFDSYQDIETTENVVDSIDKIVRNSRRNSLESYFERVGQKHDDVHMGVIVQVQTDVEASGIVNVRKGGAYIEAVEGHLAAMISGSEPAVAFKATAASNWNSEIVDDGNDTEFALKFAGQINGIQFDKLLAVFGDCTAEFGIVGGKFVLWQVRDAYEIEIKTSETENDFLKDMKASFGSKAAAMKFFAENGLFNKPLKILKAGTSPSQVIDHVNSLFDDCQNLTLRFSRGSDIGLPRSFVSDVIDARVFLQSFYQREFTTIAHEYIKVVRSFEILVGKDYAVLEHVPGMWESDIALHPDVISVENTNAVAYRYKLPRNISLEHLEDEKRLQAPISKDEISQFVQMLNDIADVIRATKGIELPVNIHAVWDSGSDSYQCINIRNGFEPVREKIGGTEFHSVSSLSDLEKWDTKSEIRLSVLAERGDEGKLISLAKRLAELDKTLVIDFGILSHPAMVLRDFGCRLVPSYQVPQLMGKSVYEKVDLDFDIGFDAFHRISKEKRLSENSAYFAVADREPITNDHVLCVAKDFSPSVRDTNKLEQVEAIIDSLSRNDVFFYERGRASFCTSGFGEAQDHFHLVSGLDCEKTFLRLVEKTGGEVFSKLSEAYCGVPEFGEYCVFGSELTGYSTACQRVFGKRMFRENAIVQQE